MKKAFGVLVCMLVIWMLAGNSALAFRCGTRLVSVGDTKAEVAAKCGPPDWQDQWQEDRIERVYGPSANPPGSSPSQGVRTPIVFVIHVTIEEWTYNLGPSRFIRILRFENSRLVDIQTGNYGE